jgi:hypothetical protein
MYGYNIYLILYNQKYLNNKYKHNITMENVQKIYKIELKIIYVIKCKLHLSKIYIGIHYS